MGDNIIFAGCSFTWGQGLWSYLETDEHVPSYEEYIFENMSLPTGSYELRDKLRFPTLVSNHFNKTPIVKIPNGGSEYESIQFINQLFNPSDGYSFLTSRNLNYEDVDYIILQTSQIFRNYFSFHYLGDEYRITSTPSCKNLDRLTKVVYDTDKNRHENEIANFDILYKWLDDNDYSIDTLISIMHGQVLDKVETTLKFYESKGIQTRILCWQNEQLSLIFKSDFLSKRFIPLEYENQVFNSIEDMYRQYPELMLTKDPTVLHDPGSDSHPSKKCHEIISNSIIKHIYTK